MKKTIIILLLVLLFDVAHLAAQTIYVGNTTPNNTSNFTSGNNIYDTVYVGYATNSSNNELGIYNTNTFFGSTNSNDSLNVIGAYGDNNRLIISNGATVNFGDLGYGVTSLGVSSSSNTILVTGTNSSFINNAFYLGYSNNSFNNIIVSNGATMTVASFNVALLPNSVSNNIIVTGANSSCAMFYFALGFHGSCNGMTLSNGGQIITSSGYLGFTNGASSNTILITGSNSDLKIIGTNNFYESNNPYALNIGLKGPGNSVTISNEAQLEAASFVLGYDVTSSNNSLTINNATVSTKITDPTITNPYSFVVGNNGAGNSVTISAGGCFSNSLAVIGANATASNNNVLLTDTNSIWFSTNDFYDGFSGGNNSFVISNGAQLFVTGITQSNISYGNSYVGINSSSNTALITGVTSLWSNSGGYYVGTFGSDNLVTISSGAQLIDNATITTNSTVITTNPAGCIGWMHSSSNNAVLLTGSNSSWINKGDLAVGYDGVAASLTINPGYVFNYNGYIGFSTNSSNNAVIVTGNNSFWQNNGNLYVGYNGSLNNSLLITNGGYAIDNNSVISYSNTAYITGTNSLWSNSGTLTINSNAILTVSNYGTVIATNIINYGSLIVTNGGTVIGPITTN